MVIDNAPNEHPVDRLARIERLAREGIDAATAALNTVPTRTVGEVLTSLEAAAQRKYKAAFACGRFDVLEAAAHIDLPSGERVVIGYDCLGKTSYWYREQEFEQLQRILNRAICLLMLEQRLAVRA